MNSIRKIQELNKRELENGVSLEASWHADYRDTAYIYIGGLPFELSEGDIITIFSQFGEPTFVHLVRDKDTGKSRGFAFLKYEDQRSTDLAVDNLGGATIMGRMLRVDHTRYKKGDHEVEGDTDTKSSRTGVGELAAEVVQKHKVQSTESDEEAERPMLKEERELDALIRGHDDDDPMKAFLIEEKREEVLAARMRQGASKSSRKNNRERRHHKPHRTRDGDYYAEEKRSSLRRREERNHSRSMSKDDSYKDSGAYDCVEDKRSSRRGGDNRAPSISRSNDRYAKRDGYL